MKMLSKKVIYVLSPQNWGTMFISKHHYALELAKAGNTVYFINPPKQQGMGARVKMEPTGHQGLTLVNHELPFPYRLKFHVPGLFRQLMTFHIRRLIRKIGSAPDIVWSFDIGNIYPFSAFPQRTIRIFHPVDEPLNEAALESGNGCDVIFSVTREILEKYARLQKPSYFVNHGVSEVFIQEAVGISQSGNTHPKIGISGNLLRRDIDHEILLQIIREHPEAQFHFWGSYQTGQSNIGGESNQLTERFIQALSGLTHVILHGPVSTSELVKGYRAMDVFLICYDVNRDQSKGTNYHKIMEFLATGKTVVSNNVTTYADRPDLVSMVRERNHNRRLPELFSQVVRNLSLFNSPENMENRIAYARANTYDKQLERIDEALQELSI